MNRKLYILIIFLMIQQINSMQGQDKNLKELEK